MARRALAEHALSRAETELDDAYRGVRVKAGKGAAHARTVARVLRDAGCPEAVQVAGLLHDIVEDTDHTVADVRRRFGATVAGLVAAVTEDDTIRDYRARKRALRAQIAAAGPAAIDIALADKVATLTHALDSGTRLPRRKLAHYEATIALGSGAAHPALGAAAGELLAAAIAARGTVDAGR
jgi:(p)ppGpp synthase/HD superfamily hydrolase